MNTQNVLFPDYVEFLGYYDSKDFESAAAVILKLLRIMCTHPQIHEDYQLPSITHFLKEASKGPDWTYEAFEHILKAFLGACQAGKMIDIRVASN